MSAFLLWAVLGVAAVWLLRVALLGRKLKSLKQEPLTGEWVRVEAALEPLFFLVSVRGERRVATSQTPFETGQSARIAASGSPLEIEP